MNQILEVKAGDTLVIRIGEQYYTYTIVIKPDDSSRSNSMKPLDPFVAG
jgi:ribosomal 50S subunit-recycling heat shock protein